MSSTGYMCPDKIQKYGSRSRTSTATIECTCYDRLIFQVCPDPKDVQRCQTVQKAYELGQYVAIQVFWITEEQYKQFKK